MRIGANFILLLAILGRADLQNLQPEHDKGGPVNNVLEIEYQVLRPFYCDSYLEQHVNVHWQQHVPDICHNVSSSCTIVYESKCLDGNRIKTVMRHIPERNMEDINNIINGSAFRNIQHLSYISTSLTSSPCSPNSGLCTTPTIPIPHIGVSMTTIATIIGCGLGLVAVTLLGFIALKILRSFNAAGLAVSGNARPETLALSNYRRVPNNRYTPMPGEGARDRSRPPTLPAPIPFRPPIKKQDTKEDEGIYDFIDPEAKGAIEDDGYLRPMQVVGLNVSCSVTTMTEKFDKKSNDGDGYMRPSPLCPDTTAPRRTPEAAGEGRGWPQVPAAEDPSNVACAQQAPTPDSRSPQAPEKKAYDKESDDTDEDWDASYMTTIAYVNINLTARTSRVPPVDSGAATRREDEEEDPECKYDRISAGATVFH